MSLTNDVHPNQEKTNGTFTGVFQQAKTSLLKTVSELKRMRGCVKRGRPSADKGGCGNRTSATAVSGIKLAPNASYPLARQADRRTPGRSGGPVPNVAFKRALLSERLRVRGFHLFRHVPVCPPSSPPLRPVPASHRRQWPQTCA